PECTQMGRKMHQNVSLGSNGVDRVRSLGKILTRFRGTNFCTRSACFPPSFLRQPNSAEYTQMVQNAPKCQFRVKWGGSGAFVVKKTQRDFVARILQSCCPISTEFRKTTKRSRMHPNGTKNAPKHQFWVQWSGSGTFVGKNSEAISWHELWH